VTDRRQLSMSADLGAARRCLTEQARYAITAGVTHIQVRERDLEAADLAAIVAELVALSHGSQTRVLVNDRVDVALACGAAGVHLRGDSAAPAAVRRVVGRDFVIGASVHTLDEAVAAAGSVDYITVGTVWPTASKESAAPPLGAVGLARIAASVGVPVLAIGGVTRDRLSDAARAGAAGAAAIGLFIGPVTSDRDACRAISIDEVVRAARAAFDTPGSAS
jgi:thiamine-phosphate pyrophosphorylase